MTEYSPSETCHFCNKSLDGEKYVWVCRSCGTAWCNEHKKTHFKWDWLVGLDKEQCPKCRAMLKNNYDLISEFHAPSEEPISTGPVAMPVSAEPIGQATNEIEVHDPPVQGGDTVVMRRAAPKSIVGPVLSLMFFGPLAVYGVVALFVLSSEGFYWILLSLGCIGFGGRASYYAIGGIADYVKERKQAEGHSPAGWLPDPSGRHEMRYWSGHSWTEHVSDSGVQSVDSL